MGEGEGGWGTGRLAGLAACSQPSAGRHCGSSGSDGTCLQGAAPALQVCAQLGLEEGQHVGHGRHAGRLCVAIVWRVGDGGGRGGVAGSRRGWGTLAGVLAGAAALGCTRLAHSSTHRPTGTPHPLTGHAVQHLPLLQLVQRHLPQPGVPLLGAAGVGATQEAALLRWAVAGRGAGPASHTSLGGRWGPGRQCPCAARPAAASSHWVGALQPTHPPADTHPR